MINPRVFSTLVLQPLERIFPTEDFLKELLISESVSLLDSKMIIEDGFEEFEEALLVSPETAQLKLLKNFTAFETIIQETENVGLGKTFHNLIDQFGLSMVSLFANPDQVAQVESWLSQRIHGSYLMTDAGGPDLNSWKTIYAEDEEALFVDKLWGIESHHLSDRFYLISARKPKSFLPVNILLDPARVEQLCRKAIGRPFLNGALQLGNVSGKVSVKPSDLLNKGGLTLTNSALTIARSRFVRTVIAHVKWLDSQGRLRLDDRFARIFECLSELGARICAETCMDMRLVDTTLAYKFASNSALLAMVRHDMVVNGSDARDLLALSKMEGSSYRCFLELYSHRKKRRVHQL